jgi:hypothetical protein
MNRVEGKKCAANQRNPGGGGKQVEKKLIYQKGHDGVKNHVRKMVTCREKSIKLAINTVGENSDGTVIDERFTA